MAAPPRINLLGGRDPTHRPVAFPRNVLAAGLVSFVTDVSSEMIVPVLPIFLTTVLGAPVTAVGLIEGVAESTASIVRVFAGSISDRTGRRKPLMLFGYGLANLTKPLLAVSTAWPQVLAIRFGDRFGKGIRGAPRDALIADSVDVSVRGRAFGFHRGMDTAGAAIGPLLASATLAFAGDNPRVVFWLASVPGIASVLIGWWLLKDRPVVPKDTSPPQLGFRDLGRAFAVFTAILSAEVAIAGLLAAVALAASGLMYFGVVGHSQRAMEQAQNGVRAAFIGLTLVWGARELVNLVASAAGQTGLH